MKTAIEKAPTGALFSHDRRYRYLLWRSWAGLENLVLFIGLNPSLADETSNDPTIRRMIGFAKREHATGVLVANLFSYCATDPRDMKTALRPVGRANKSWLLAAQRLSTRTIACWGNHGSNQQCSQQLLPDLGPVFCFGKTKNGEPKHPLYLRSDAELRSMVE